MSGDAIVLPAVMLYGAIWLATLLALVNCKAVVLVLCNTHLCCVANAHHHPLWR